MELDFELEFELCAVKEEVKFESVIVKGLVVKFKSVKGEVLF